MTYRWPYRSEPIEPRRFWTIVFIVVLNLLIFAPYLYVLLWVIAPRFITFFLPLEP